MCTSNEYTYVYPDGRREKLPRQTTLCPASRHGVPCAHNVVYKYPPQQVPFPGQQASSAPAASSPYLSAQFPPTPTYTPRSTTPNYRSGDESDRSAGYHSGSSASRSKGSSSKRAPTVYINGQKVYDSFSRRGERVVLVDGPSTPRTPPSKHASPNMPSSPVSPYIVDADRRQSSSSSRRPVIVDDSGRVEIDIVDADRRGHRREHKRHTSSSSYNSYDEDDLARHRRKEAERGQRRQAERESRLRGRIAQANAEIADRPPVPQAPQPPRRSATFSRKREAELVDAVRRMDIKDSERRRQEAEDEAQRQRLMERMMPRRSATVSGGRRHRVVYEDGTYGWE